MICPVCETETGRYRSPAYRDGVVLRRHRCPKCRHVFISAQVVVTPQMASKLEEMFA